jgi:hypothetical protein
MGTKKFEFPSIFCWQRKVVFSVLSCPTRAHSGFKPLTKFLAQVVWQENPIHVYANQGDQMSL